MHIRTIKAGDGPLLKAITLLSVEEDPYAFGGAETLEIEQKRSDAEWATFAAEFGGEVPAWRDRCVGYFIVDDESICAKAIAFLSFKDPTLAAMSGVWVDRDYRRQGLGKWLVTEACAWAKSKGANRLQLWVDDTNPDGVKFYSALGFKPTGKSRPVGLTSTDCESAFELMLGDQRDHA